MQWPMQQQPSAGWGLGGGYAQQQQQQQWQQQQWQMQQQRMLQQQQMQMQQQQQWQQQQQQQQPQRTGYQGRNYQPGYGKGGGKGGSPQREAVTGGSRSSGDADLDARLAARLKAIEARTGKQCNTEFASAGGKGYKGGKGGGANIDSDLDSRINAKLRSLEGQMGDEKTAAEWADAAKNPPPATGGGGYKGKVASYPPEGYTGGYKGSNFNPAKGKGGKGGAEGGAAKGGTQYSNSPLWVPGGKDGKGTYKGKGARHPDSRQPTEQIDADLSARIDERLRNIEQKISQEKEAGSPKQGSPAREAAPASPKKEGSPKAGSPKSEGQAVATS